LHHTRQPFPLGRANCQADDIERDAADWSGGGAEFADGNAEGNAEGTGVVGDIARDNRDCGSGQHLAERARAPEYRFQDPEKYRAGKLFPESPDKRNDNGKHRMAKTSVEFRLIAETKFPSNGTGNILKGSEKARIKASLKSVARMTTVVFVRENIRFKFPLTNLIPNTLTSNKLAIHFTP
jgi:hypothetical protein